VLFNKTLIGNLIGNPVFLVESYKTLENCYQSTQLDTR